MPSNSHVETLKVRTRHSDEVYESMHGGTTKGAVDRPDVSIAHARPFLPVEEKGPWIPTTRPADASSVGCPLRSTGRRIADGAEGPAYTGWQR
jgi:hypothetical protein